jgi:hypothetical protein
MTLFDENERSDDDSSEEECHDIVTDYFIGQLLPSIIHRYTYEPCRTSQMTGNMYYEELISSSCNKCRFHQILRMDRETFLKLLEKLENCRRCLKSTRYMTAGEKAMIGIYILTGKSNREAQERWQHSGETITRALMDFAHAVLAIQNDYITKPSSNTPPEISSNPKFASYFSNCIGALDGSHIPVTVPVADAKPFRNRKGTLSQNVLAVCNFDMTFSFVLVGWEGSAHDGRVLKDAYSRGLPMVDTNKYFLGDAGYSLTKDVLTPYRGVRYHLTLS